MDQFLTDGTGPLLLVAFGVGIVIGLTGMGGGALMTPALIFLGVPPVTAVANDLVAAAVNKTVGAAVHWRDGSPDLRLAMWLILGSVPTAAAGGWLVQQLGTPEEQQELVVAAIGGALLLAAATYVLRLALNHRRSSRAATGPITIRPVPTLLVGAVGGLLVGVTSVGSGSLIMVALLMLYPRLTPRRLVGTDLVQAIPLVLAAAIGHVVYAGVDWSVLLPLIIGGGPGTYLGARLASRVPTAVVRHGIVVVLTITGLTLLEVPTTWVVIVGAAMLVLGPVLRGVGRGVATPVGREETAGGDPEKVAAGPSPDHDLSTGVRALGATSTRRGPPGRVPDRLPRHHHARTGRGGK